ncbi:MAG: right-handed parallel beta-helix repeat-containing protein [Isosphaeraceae bacterium]
MSETRWIFAAAILCLQAAALEAGAADDLAERLRLAKPGSTIELPPGTHRLGDVKLPPGVSLRGAGYESTILDASGHSGGVRIEGGREATISDLTIQGAGETALKVVGGRDLTIRRVRLRGDVAGLAIEGARDVRAENLIVTDGLTGITLRDAEHVAICQATIVRANSIGINLLGTRRCAVFNNLIVDSGIGVQVAGEHPGLLVDHNLHVAQYVGRIGDDPPRVSLPTWRDASSGLDAHSVQLGVRFADAAKQDFRVVSGLEWNPAKATTSDWGTARAGNQAAPAADIAGRSRLGLPDVGAFESGPLAGAASPDGAITVEQADGSKSAGIFREDGTLVRYLFQDLPLPPGRHEFVLPARDQLGGKIEPGRFVVKVVEGKLSWTYRRMVANSGLDNSTDNADQFHNGMVAFPPGDAGRLLLGSGWSERHVNIRCIGLDDRKARWQFGGSADIRGLDVDPRGHVYLLRGTEKVFSLVRLNSSGGELIPWEASRPVALLETSGVYSTLAALGDSLYLAVPELNQVQVLDASTAGPRGTIEIPRPRVVAADRTRGILWVISDFAKLLAVTPGGKVLRAFDEAPSPIGLAVRGDRLAVASYETGKIHLLDIEGKAPDALRLKSAWIVGRGDGPYGPIVPDRFWFQKGRHNAPASVSLALADDGTLAIRDTLSRVISFSPEGNVLLHTFAQFGNTPHRAPFGDPPTAPTRFLDASGTVSWTIDARAGTWAPEAYWGHPPSDLPGSSAVGFFAREGKRFGVYRCGWKLAPNQNRDGLMIVRFEDFSAVPLAFYAAGRQGGHVVIRDRNEDGHIDADDGEGEPIKNTDGKPASNALIQRFTYVEPSGDIRAAATQRWVCKGLDSQARPIYEFPARPAFAFREARLASPYTAGVQNDPQAQSESAMTPDGGYLACFPFQQGSPLGMGFSNSGGVDLARFRPDGRLRWYRPLNDYSPIQGVKISDDGRFLLCSWGHQVEWFGMTADGLGLGRIGLPAEGRWSGYWVDHPDQYTLFRGNDGKLHVIAGDYVINAMHWMTLDGTQPTREAGLPLEITGAKAAELTARTWSPPAMAPRPAPPRVVVRRLASPLAVDGDPATWRRAGISPQIVITPVTGHGAISGPADLSGVVRLAYHGRDLFVQVVQFDDAVTFHQPTANYHQQDTVGVMLNGFMDGFQWNLGRFADVPGDVLVRRRFYFGNLTLMPPPDVAPRVIRIINADDVRPERALVESATGRSLDGAKAVVFEFRLPIDRRTYQSSEEAIFPVEPGKGFWLGIMLRDNDLAGADLQDYEVWPPSFGTFEVKEKGAWAVFE